MPMIRPFLPLSVVTAQCSTGSGSLVASGACGPAGSAQRAASRLECGQTPATAGPAGRSRRRRTDRPRRRSPRTCSSSSSRVRLRHKGGKHLDRAVRLELEDEKLVPDQYFEVGERQMHELLARDIQRERAALVERPVGGDDIEHRPGQGLVEPSGLQHRHVGVRLGLSCRQLFRAISRGPAARRFRVEAEKRLHERASRRSRRISAPAAGRARRDRNPGRR